VTYRAGALYGTTQNGGANAYGSVFKVTTGGKESVLYSFTGGPDGAYPLGGLTLLKGKFYGTTSSNAGSVPNGAVFAMTPAGNVTVLHQFGGSGDGRNAQAGLTNVDGTLYGTTAEGGADGVGSVFSITPSGAESVLFSFNLTDGEQPKAPVVAIGHTLYGTTQGGGGPEQGTVFSLPI
jgi:uncharacterized repeat protein (TIGR03803 family)